MSTAARHRDDRTVAVVGGGLAGMAVAARLAKKGYSVTLFEAHHQLGGSWAPREFAGITVDDLPSVIGFPAPWRDLFRKSGRPLEAELAKAGHDLVPAPPAVHRFSDGSELVLGSERGEQYRAISDAFGTKAADRWRDLLDRLDQVWQAVRPLGYESVPPANRRSIERTTRRLLTPRMTIGQLADSIEEPHLAAMIRTVAYRGWGSDPVRTPAWCAIDLSLDRRFGRWMITGEQPGRSSVLTELLAARLALRRVDVRLDQPVTRIASHQSGAMDLQVANDVLTASAIVCTVNPWDSYGTLVPAAELRTERRRALRLTPALAPTISFRLLDQPASQVGETIDHTGRAPIISWSRPVERQTLLVEHDYTRSRPDPAQGVRWRRFNDWFARPPIVSRLPRLWWAGPFSAAGPSASATLLSAALAATECDALLDR